MQTAGIATKFGTFTARFTEAGLAGLDFPDRTARAPQLASTDESPVNLSRLAEWKQQTAAALRDALEGRQPETLPPLDLSCGSTFQRRVWLALLDIAPGATRSYSEIAQAVGKPQGARAVGAACGSNPIPVLVPCHRVLAAGGRLGGFSGGLDWKRRLLGLEGSRSLVLAPG